MLLTPKWNYDRAPDMLATAASNGRSHYTIASREGQIALRAHIFKMRGLLRKKHA